MRLSGRFWPTLRDAPADAEAISHKLMIRAGLIRQLAAGLYSFLPFGLRSLQRVTAIIREEMDRIGAQEFQLPVMHPAEIWQATGRYWLDEQFRLEDRGGRAMVLGMTHEEIITWHAAREIRSYRDLPQSWYQFQTKLRDEPRPKSGILRVREFTMKDAYSLDADEDGLARSYDAHAEAYARIFDRCGLEWYMVESDVGMMGGMGAHEFMAPSPAGEDTIARAPSGAYAANVELATSVAVEPDFGAAARGRSRPSRRPASASIEELAAFTGLPAARLAKSVVVVSDDGPVLALVRGSTPCTRRSSATSWGPIVRRSPTRSARGSARAPARSAPSASGGAHRRRPPSPPATTSPARTVTASTCAASCSAAISRPRSPTSAPYWRAKAARSPANHSSRAGHRARQHLQARYQVLPNRSGRRYLAPPTGTSGRSSWAHTASGRRACWRPRSSSPTTRRGIVWPKALAPFDVHMVLVGDHASPQAAFAAALYDQLSDAGLAVLLDDREGTKPGEKFVEAELLGCPIRVTIGKRTLPDGPLEIQIRRGRERREVPAASRGRRDPRAAGHAAMTGGRRCAAGLLAGDRWHRSPVVA